MRRALTGLLAGFLGLSVLTACGSQCGPGTQEFNGTCVSDNDRNFDDDDRFEDDDDD